MDIQDRTSGKNSLPVVVQTPGMDMSHVNAKAPLTNSGAQDQTPRQSSRRPGKEAVPPAQEVEDGNMSLFEALCDKSNNSSKKRDTIEETSS